MICATSPTIGELPSATPQSLLDLKAFVFNLQLKNGNMWLKTGSCSASSEPYCPCWHHTTLQYLANFLHFLQSENIGSSDGDRIIDVDMFQFTEKSMRGGVSYLHPPLRHYRQKPRKCSALNREASVVESAIVMVRQTIHAKNTMRRRPQIISRI